MASNCYAAGSLGTDQQVYHGCEEAKNEVGETVPITTNPRDIAMLPFEPGLHDGATQQDRSTIFLPNSMASGITTAYAMNSKRGISR